MRIPHPAWCAGSVRRGSAPRVHAADVDKDAMVDVVLVDFALEDGTRFDGIQRHLS